MVKFR